MRPVMVDVHDHFVRDSPFGTANCESAQLSTSSQTGTTGWVAASESGRCRILSSKKTSLRSGASFMISKMPIHNGVRFTTPKPSGSASTVLSLPAAKTRCPSPPIPTSRAHVGSFVIGFVRTAWWSIGPVSRFAGAPSE